jgi:hypothetical protein
MTRAVSMSRTAPAHVAGAHQAASTSTVLVARLPTRAKPKPINTSATRETGPSPLACRWEVSRTSVSLMAYSIAGVTDRHQRIRG